MALIAFIFILLLSIPAMAQIQPQHPMKVYTDSTGKIFVNLKQPLYFKISSSPEKNAKKITLNPHNTTSPIYLQHEGLNVCYTPWAVDTATKKMVHPKVNVYYHFYADGTPPFTKLKTNFSPFVKNGQKFFNNKLVISLKAYDKISGTEQTFYSINGEPFKTYSGPIKFDDQGSFSLKYYSVDHVGNVEKIKIYEFNIDATTPSTKLVINGKHKDDILAPGARIVLSSDDDLSGFSKIFYAIDDQNFRIYKAPISVAHLLEGEHEIIYYAVDNTGNKEPADTANFFVDKTAPLILEDIVGENYFINGKQYLSVNSRLKLWAIDNKAGVEAIYYSFDGKTWHKYTEPVKFPRTNEKIMLRYYAIDSLGNKSNIDYSEQSSQGTGGFFQTFVDLDPPVLKYSFINTFSANNTVFMGKNSKIRLQAYDNESGVKNIQYQIDSADVVNYDKPFSIAQEGKHTVYIFSHDQINNLAMDQFTVTVDTTAPKLSVIYGIKPIKTAGDTIFLPENTIIFLTATDNLCGVKSISYSINSQKKITGNSMIRNLPKNKLSTIKISAIDFLGNRSEKTIKIKVTSTGK